MYLDTFRHMSRVRIEAQDFTSDFSLHLIRLNNLP